MTRSPNGQQSPQRAVRFRTAAQNTIYDVLKARNWVETSSESEWDFLWADTGGCEGRVARCLVRLPSDQKSLIGHLGYRLDPRVLRSDALFRWAACEPLPKLLRANAQRPAR
eukprot:scaffold978_cov392-Prasinococcus_capsulatus_cf.AAC.16